MATAPVRAPRIIVELADDGTWIIEHYINGARQRIHVPRGMEAIEARDCLAEQRRDIARQMQAAAERKAREEASRHTRVYNTARADHGTYFADRFIGRPRRGNIPDPNFAPQPPATRQQSAKTNQTAKPVIKPIENYADLL